MRLPLGVVLSLCLAGLQFVAVVGVVTSSYVTSERALLDHARELLSDVAANTIEHSRGFLRPARGAVELATRLAENEIVASDNTALLEKLLFQQLITAPQFAGVFYGNEGGNFVYVMRSTGPGPFRSKIVTHTDAGRSTELIWRSTDFEVLETRDDPKDTYDPRDRPWYLRVSEELRSVWTDPYIFFTSQTPGITVAAPVFGDGDGALHGVIGVDIEINAISEFLSQLSIGQSGKALILNRNGDVIAHPNPSLIKTKNDDGTLRFAGIDEINDPISRSAFGYLTEMDTVSIDQEIAASFEYDGANFVSTITPIISDTLPWTIGVFAPEDDFIGGIKTNRAQNIVIAAAVAGMTALIGLVLANHIHKPIRLLAQRATQISRGEHDLCEPFPRTFRELERANETMVKEVARREKSELEYGRTFDLASRGMAQISADTGRFIRVNKKFSDIMGYDAETLSNMKIQDIAHPDEGSNLRYLAEAARGDAEYLYETRYIRSDGSSVWVLLNAITIYDDTGLPLHTVATFDDITEKKLAEAQIQKLNYDLSHRARLNTMGEMAASLAHELNQPLTAITQNTDAALMTAAELSVNDPELLDILKDVDEQAHRAAEIIRALRSFVRKDEDTKTTFDLSDLLQQTIRLVQADAKEKGIRIDLRAGPLPSVQGSRVQIAQVLVNLLRNAIEAIAPTTDNRRRVTVDASAWQTEIKVTVTDTGPGVDPTISLFTQFETTKSDGMGLGLAISRAIINAHGGNLWYEADAVEAGQFLFTLPVKGS